MQNYYATRYPEEKVYIYNAGISGDTTRRSLLRIGWDAEPLNFNKAVVNLGMNDVVYSNYDGTSAKESLRQASINDSKDALDDLIEMLGDIPITLSVPSPYDQTASGDGWNKNYFGANGGIRVLGKNMSLKSELPNISLVDYNTPMVNINSHMQKLDPSSSLINKDRVHPNALGQTIMAYIFLKAQNVPSTVSDIEIAADENQVVKNVNCAVESLDARTDGISFYYVPNSLPMPVHDKYNEANSLVDFTNDLNREIIKVTGLDEGRYTLSFGNSVAGTYTKEQLENGINIATLSSNPGQIKALAVNAKQTQRITAEKVIRDCAIIRHLLEIRGFDMNDPTSTQAGFQDILRTNPNYQTYIDKYNIYVTNADETNNVDNLRRQITNLIDEMYEINTPTPFVVTIAKVID